MSAHRRLTRTVYPVTTQVRTSSELRVCKDVRTGQRQDYGNAENNGFFGHGDNPQLRIPKHTAAVEMPLPELSGVLDFRRDFEFRCCLINGFIVRSSRGSKLPISHIALGIAALHFGRFDRYVVIGVAVGGRF